MASVLEELGAPPSNDTSLQHFASDYTASVEHDVTIPGSSHEVNARVQVSVVQPQLLPLVVVARDFSQSDCTPMPFRQPTPLQFGTQSFPNHPLAVVGLRVESTNSSGVAQSSIPRLGNHQANNARTAAFAANACHCPNNESNTSSLPEAVGRDTTNNSSSVPSTEANGRKNGAPSTVSNFTGPGFVAENENNSSQPSQQQQPGEPAPESESNDIQRGFERSVGASSTQGPLLQSLSQVDMRTLAALHQLLSLVLLSRREDTPSPLPVAEDFALGLAAMSQENSGGGCDPQQASEGSSLVSNDGASECDTLLPATSSDEGKDHLSCSASSSGDDTFEYSQSPVCR